MCIGFAPIVPPGKNVSIVGQLVHLRLGQQTAGLRDLFLCTARDGDGSKAENTVL